MPANGVDFSFPSLELSTLLGKVPGYSWHYCPMKSPPCLVDSGMALASNLLEPRSISQSIAHLVPLNEDELAWLAATSVERISPRRVTSTPRDPYEP